MEYMPKGIIPQEYGGAGGTIAEITGWLHKVLLKQHFLYQK